MWLTGRLTPDFKTIANFRKDNGVGIRNVCRQFVLLCRNLDLFTQQLIAIDGSKFKAVNNRDRNFTKAKVQARLQQIEESIERYLSMLDTIDRTEPTEAPAKAARLQDKIIHLKEQMQALKQVEVRLQAAPDGQISLTDPDARSMATSGRGTGMVGYNVQAAVDTTHHLIVAHEVTNIGNDRSQLANMSEQAREATGIEKLAVVADRGYFSGEEVLACDQAGITAYVPKPLTSGAKADGRFGKQQFVYMPDRGEYRCPAGHAMTHRVETQDKCWIYVRRTLRPTVMASANSPMPISASPEGVGTAAAAPLPPPPPAAAPLGTTVKLSIAKRWGLANKASLKSMIARPNKPSEKSKRASESVPLATVLTDEVPSA
jgi:hypothetical protein